MERAERSRVLRSQPAAHPHSETRHGLVIADQGPGATQRHDLARLIRSGPVAQAKRRQLSTLFAGAIGYTHPVQREIVDEADQAMTFGEVVAAVDRDPSATIQNAQARGCLRDLIDEATPYPIAEILTALGGGPRFVQRQDGDITLHPPLLGHVLPLHTIAGTHASVAKTFEDGRTVEEMVKALVADPSIVTNTPNFVLTVFRSTAPGDPNGAPRTWSMNNRRLKAMQEADAQLQAQEQPQRLPPIPVKWATKDDMNYAIRPAKFGNRAHAQVDFHSAGTRVARLGVLTQNNATPTPNARDVRAAMNDSDALAKLLGL